MNKVVLITGGSRGIGLGIARCLANENVDLAINGRRPQKEVEPVLQELCHSGNSVIYCQADISDRDARNQMFQIVRQKYGRLNVLINNAGVAPTDRKDILQASEESFEYVIKANLQGSYFLTQAAANWMIEQKEQNGKFSGCIINISSISATMASPNRGEYCIAKAGMSMATKLFATRLGEYEIPVYEIQPGITKTDMTTRVTEKYDKMIAEGLCVQRRWGQPDDVGIAVASLVRGDFPYSSGQVFMVDGGLTVPRRPERFSISWGGGSWCRWGDRHRAGYVPRLVPRL